jgi:hypothetical protein
MRFFPVLHNSCPYQQMSTSHLVQPSYSFPFGLLAAQGRRLSASHPAPHLSIHSSLRTMPLCGYSVCSLYGVLSMDLETKSLHNAASSNACFLLCSLQYSNISASPESAAKGSRLQVRAKLERIKPKSTLVGPHASIRTEWCKTLLECHLMYEHIVTVAPQYGTVTVSAWKARITPPAPPTELSQPSTACLSVVRRCRNWAHPCPSIGPRA